MFTNVKQKTRTIRPAIRRGPKIEKTVNPYDADWKASLSARDFVASPTCMTVRTMAMCLSCFDPEKDDCQY